MKTTQISEAAKQHDMEDSVTGKLKNTFGKSVELAEGAIDSIISSYSRQMKMNLDGNTKLMEAVKNSDSKTHDKVLNVIQNNFEAVRELTINNTKEILDFYNKHTNLAVNFNEQFSENINVQLASLFNIQSKGHQAMTDWTNAWRKQSKKETTT
jgi:hypothetical protein